MTVRSLRARFFFVFLYRELRRRRRQGLLTGLGLGLGVGLVMVVSAASAGVAAAQAVALRSLYGISTGLTVTEPVRQPGALQDPHALLTGGLALLPSALAASVSRLPHVASAAGDLQLTELKPAPGGLWASITVDGADTARPALGPRAAGTMVAGREFTPADGAADVAVVDDNYATASKLRVDSPVDVAGTRFKVIGIVRQVQGAGLADIYIPLGAAQWLGRSHGGERLSRQVNVIYAAADSVTHVAEVQREISRLVPAATITSNSDLAKAVTGGLQSAASLIGRLGTWVAVAALTAAFAVASLLTIGAVTRRTREFGTLKALGWTSRRITGQIIGESLAIGVAGTAIGLTAGFSGISLINGLAPTLSATVPRNNGSGEAATVAIRLAAHVNPAVIAVAALLAIGGAVLAGALGAWRAARLQPADAFARIT
jgi:putative ABC transport system permease protein